MPPREFSPSASHRLLDRAGTNTKHSGRRLIESSIVQIFGSEMKVARPSTHPVATT
jgi:hypothetical protein